MPTKTPLVFIKKKKIFEMHDKRKKTGKKETTRRKWKGKKTDIINESVSTRSLRHNGLEDMKDAVM